MVDQALTGQRRGNTADGAGQPAALETLGLRKSFGALRVADGIDFRLADGARHALIGPNGAGKTTLINLITGALPPSAGRIRLRGTDITRLPQHARVRLGLARTFQINQLFGALAVIDHVALALAERTGASRHFWRPLGREDALLDEAFALLDTLGLAPVALQPARTLPYGAQRIVEIAIALAARPRILLLDEPAAGVPAADTRAILDAIERLHEDIAVLIVEHDMDLVFRFARRITVMVGGAILTEGTRAEIAADPRVRAAYLGRRQMAERASALELSRAARRLRRHRGPGAFDLRIRRGECVAVLGRNGVGKIDAARDHHGPHDACRTGPSGSRARTSAAGAPPARARRARLGAPGARDLPFAHGARQPRRGEPARRLDRGARLRRCSRACASAPASRAARCPAASSRCWRSPARWSATRRCC